MSLDSKRSGYPRQNAANSNVFTITAHPGLLPPEQPPQQQQQQQSSSSPATTTTQQQLNSDQSQNQQQQQPQQQQPANQEVEITYTDIKTIGNGSFGVVFQATLLKPTHEQIAIKKVLQDKRFKNRELQIMRKLDHCNVVKLKYFFHTMGDRGNSDVYLHLVLEYIPETLYRIARNHSRNRQNLPMILVKLYMYQLFRSLNYIHSMDICHRDIKPQNLLLNPETGVLKLCDFGSAKSLVGGEPNVAYICSRYYRAPELIFGATDYTTKIDIWSAGCVMAELILGEPMFPGESGVDQLVEIIKVLGTPTREQMRAMNPNYTEFRFPVIRARSWNRIFSSHLRTPPEAAKLVSNLLEYTPSNRLTPLGACAHTFFDELRTSSTRELPTGRKFPPLFNFSDEEFRKEPHLASRLIPSQISADSQQQHRNSSNTSATTPSTATSAIPATSAPAASASTTTPSATATTNSGPAATPTTVPATTPATSESTITTTASTVTTATAMPAPAAASSQTATSATPPAPVTSSSPNNTAASPAAPETSNANATTHIN